MSACCRPPSPARPLARPEKSLPVLRSEKADVWSVGCVIVEMLTGNHPYHPLNQFAAIYKVKRARVCSPALTPTRRAQISQGEPPPYPEDGLSQEAKDFIALCFLQDPKKRPRAEELLKHPFLQQEASHAAHA
jgi:serine/threonine protein kinase